MQHVSLFVILLCQDVHSLAADISCAVCNAAEVLFGVSPCQHSFTSCVVADDKDCPART